MEIEQKEGVRREIFRIWKGGDHLKRAKREIESKKARENLQRDREPRQKFGRQRERKHE